MAVAAISESSGSPNSILFIIVFDCFLCIVVFFDCCFVNGMVNRPGCLGLTLLLLLARLLCFFCIASYSWVEVILIREKRRQKYT